MARKIWGVDSANPVDKEFFECVKKKYGVPKYWGRYLTEIPNVSRGLTKSEIGFLRSKDIKILPIYNVIREAIGYEEAQLAARNAVFHARRLGIPTNTIIFANVEKFFNVDSSWIRGWVETFIPSGYKAGFYNDSVEGDFAEAYCEAVKENSEVAVQTILWSAAPELGATSERKAPKFKPASPDCKANVWLWQYGRDAKHCPIDTNLADERVLNYLY
ncbi:glycoside hydrolase domain-containing protein [Metabacillus litoralis]|uniref:glycoside hydrolase domain-containing protein n=1 Tax=Metabacillus litoralis TaxID=152268 RepID=UPI001CFF25BB|nr:glycoside hydrolase domain-containing protein [Metabacillus litoralis]